MSQSGSVETLKLTPRESIAVRGSTPEALEVEATYGPGGKPPPKHLHPGQDEHFRCLEGSVRVRVGDHERELAAGDEIEFPRRTPHQMWNPRTSPHGSDGRRGRPGGRWSGFAASTRCTVPGGSTRMGCPERSRSPS